MSIPPVPQFFPSPVELDDLELLVTRALGPGLTAFNQPGSPVTLTLPDPVAAQARSVGAVEIVDPEDLPLARVSWPAGVVEPLTRAQYGPFRDLALTPADVREQHAGRTVVPVAEPLTRDQLDAIATLGPVTLLVLVGHGTSSLSPVGLVRASRAAARLLPDAVVVTVPLGSHGDADAELRQLVVSTYAATDGVHVPAVGAEDTGYPEDVAAVVSRDRPPPERQGLVVFFTGLSGSGKSTLARALVDLLLEQGERTVSSLDGDVVRRHLSAGLTFSRADRETNILRIGWVAAEVARHHGVAVVSPIAPYDETRQQVRTLVTDNGGAFFLVHVATPLEECERRDRKGLYAKARAGQIPEFTGISSPYEAPVDADVVVDTTGRTIDDALGDVLDGLREAGYVHLAAAPPPDRVAEPESGPDTAHDELPLRVLFVCTANICRSPSMQVLAQSLTSPEDRIELSSAGTHGFAEHPIDDQMRSALPPGVDATQFLSRKLDNDMLDHADLVLTAEAAHRSFILEDRPELFRRVFTLGQFAQCLEHAPAGLTRAELLAHVAEMRGNADAALDVSDPYRRGPEAAAECVEHLQQLLGTVVPALASSATSAAAVRPSDAPSR